MDTKKHDAFTGQYIAIHMREKGIKQSWLAKKLHVSKSTVSRWISGDIHIDDETMGKLEQLLGVSTGHLRAKEENIFESDIALARASLRRRWGEPNQETEAGRQAYLEYLCDKIIDVTNESGQRMAISMLEMILKVPEYKVDSPS